MDIKQTDSKYVAGTYARFGAVLTSGRGATLYDENGKAYIDFGSGIGVNIFGACDDVWVQAVEAQLQKIQHTSNLYYTEPCAELAKMLCEKTGMQKVFFANSGAEVNECAIKTARKYAFDKYGEAKKTIITLENSFHGRTLATLTATGQDSFHTMFGPFVPGFKYVPANDLAAMQNAADDSVCAIMMECVQGEGGVNVLEKDFVTGIEALCREKDILLIVDEVQTGNGRTGKLYAYEHFGITPDIVTTAKGLGGGLPIGACMLGEKVKDTLTPGSHGSTFGGNPIAAAGAVSILKRLDSALFQSVTEKGKKITTFLSGLKNVRSVSGMGLMLGVETAKAPAELANACLDKGLLVLTAKGRLRLLPPLNITDEELENGLHILKEVIEA